MNKSPRMRLVQPSDREMFTHLYQAYVEAIYHYVCVRVEDDNLAEDITSQIFLKVWKNLGTYRAEQCHFRAWLYRIAHNAIIDHYRRRKFLVPFDEVNTLKLSHNDNIDEKLDLRMESQELSRALKALTEKQQQVLVLKFIGGLSTTEIAQQLGKRQGAIRALQLRGLQALAKSPDLQRACFYKC